jgi:ATP-binding cassette subfamily B protein
MKTYNIEKIHVSDSEGYKFILNYTKPHYKRLSVILLIIIVNSLAALLNPYVIKYALDNNITTGDIGGLWKASLVLLFLVIVDAITRYIQIKMLGAFGQELLFKIRQNLFIKLQSLPLRFFSENKSGDIISRITTNVEAINSMFSEGIIRILSTIFMMIGTAILIFILNWKMSLVALVPLLFMILFLYIQGKYLNKAIKHSLDLDGKVSNQIQETLNGFQIIKSFGREDWAIREFEERNNKYFRAVIKSGSINSLGSPVLLFFSAIGTISVVIFSVSLLKSGEITLGTILAFLIYLRQFYQPLSFIGALWKNIQSGIASAQRISGIMKLETDLLVDEEPYIPLHEIVGNIEFKNVTFSYDQQVNVLKNVSFHIQPGETVAVVGPTGGGKTTFVKLIARLYDVNSGEITIDGVDVKKWDLETLRHSIGYLLQDTILFEDTILNNLKYSNPHITEENVTKLFNEMGISEFISNLSDGLGTMLVNGGENISSGQRQLICIARILLRKPKILILDEATSNIDTRTEIAVQKAIEFATKGCTSIVIAHRLSTIKNADRIILVQENKILESGTQAELLAKKGLYFEMYKSFVER